MWLLFDGSLKLYMLLSDIEIDFMISVGVLREVRALALRKRAPACC